MVLWSCNMVPTPLTMVMSATWECLLCGSTRQRYIRRRKASGVGSCWQLLCRAFGSPKEGISIGPVKFSRTAELINGRAAMVG